ncbi:hypothetical protein DV736_g5486, partial [Chaetothyriales sp. CBS 134916]
MLLPALSVLLLPSLLPCLVASNDQVPLASKAAGWLEKAKAYIPSSAAAAVASPIQAVAERTVERINIRNYKRKLGAKAGGDEEWVVYVTGGNKTCLGDCHTVDLLWNESVPLFSALTQANLHLGRLDCEKEGVLCTALQAVPPAIFHFLDDEYTGALHPFDSLLAKASLLEALGYVIWTLGNTPSWLMMILISFGGVKKRR